MISRLRLRAEYRHGRTSITDLWSCGQLAARQTGAGELHLVSRAAGPLNGDRIEVDVRVGAGAELTIRSTAATVALPAAGPRQPASEFVLRCEVADDAELRWLPLPTIVASGAHLTARSEWFLADSARLHCREITVLGRHAEHGGIWRARTVLSQGGVERLSQSMTSEALDRAGTFTGRPERVVVSELRVDPTSTGGSPSAVGAYAVTMSPATGIIIGSALGPDVAIVSADLAQTFEAQTFEAQTFEAQTFEAQTFEAQTFEAQRRLEVEVSG